MQSRRQGFPQGKRIRLQTYVQKKVFVIGLIVVLSAVLVVAGLFGFIVGMNMTVSRSDVQVPQLVGLTVKAANNLLHPLNLTLRISGERYDSLVPQGTILSQLPPQGSRSKSGRKVQTVLSKGARTHPVPNLINSTAGVAQMTSEKNNYVIGRISTIMFPGIEKDLVLAQSPAPGSTLAVTPRIDVLIVSGKESKYIMPNFLGMKLNRVKPFLEEHELKLGKVHYRFHQSLPKGTLIGQFPRSGHMVQSKDPISLEVTR